MVWGRTEDMLPRKRIDRLLDHAVASSVVIVRAPRGAGKRVAVRGWLSRIEPGLGSWSWIECDGSAGPLEAELVRHYEDAADPDTHLVVLCGYGVRHEGQVTGLLEKWFEPTPGAACFW